MPPATRIRPYKDFLTPALHRRFATATVTLTALCYIEAILIGEFNSCKPSSTQCKTSCLNSLVGLWSWFPFGRAAIRTGLLFIPAFMIFVLRVAQLHVGLRTSNSAFQTFTQYAGRFETVQTAAWYILSAYIFSEVYIWSASKESDLNRIKLIPKTDRPMLNEKPIYLTCHLLFLAIIQTGYHLFYDYDRIDMPATKTKPDSLSDERVHSNAPASARFNSRFPGIFQRSFARASVMTLVSPVIYSLTTRSIAWSITRSWAKIFWNLPKSGSLPNVRPFHWSVLFKSGSAGFLLIMLWEVGNALFSIYVAQEPLKNDRPITYESKDPNGSLLTGLRGKKLQTRVSLTNERKGECTNCF
jgi:nucleoporin NDC1